jgi:hypothetical protein
MARIEDDAPETPKPSRPRVTWTFNVANAVVPLFLICMGQLSVLASDPTVRLGAVVAALLVVFYAGSRFGRAEQARELLRGS